MTYETIKPYIDQGLVSEQSHPENPDVRIFNYTQECQWKRAWDDVTKQCRGLIMNVATGEIIARPFPKFFNYEEHVANGWPIPEEVPIIMEKYDGSLGILYELNGKPWIATRGSFTSDQAIWATKWWRENVNMLPIKNETSLFEIIFPENRIVVNYDFSGLVHLATLCNCHGSSLPQTLFWENVRRPVSFLGSVEHLKLRQEPNKEGYVLFFPNANMRMKIKFDEYVRLHKLVTGVSEIAIWEHLRDGKPITELLKDVPDEFFKWVMGVHDRLISEYLVIVNEAAQAISAASGTTDRKAQADIIKQSKYPGVAFAMLDGKDSTKTIWRMIRPKGRSQFKVDIDQ